jgi:hypothetical protein
MAMPGLGSRGIAVLVGAAEDLQAAPAARREVLVDGTWYSASSAAPGDAAA